MPHLPHYHLLESGDGRLVEDQGTGTWHQGTGRWLPPTMDILTKPLIGADLVVPLSPILPPLSAGTRINFDPYGSEGLGSLPGEEVLGSKSGLAWEVRSS